MPDLKRVLRLLDRKTLLDLSRALGFKGWSVVSKDEIARRLSRTRNLPWHELSISTLKGICRDLGVNPGAVSKQVLIEGIICPV